ncbi:MAG: ABC transporter substrate-binding protein, partial [Geminicoccaceae bacterium]
SKLGHSMDDLEMRLINTDDSIAVFEDAEVAAVATWEPMMSNIVDNTSKESSKILLSSADFDGLITDVIIVHDDDLQANPEKYKRFLRGIYRAINLYETDPDAFLAAAAPAFDVTPEEMAADLGGVQYTTYEESVEFLGTAEGPGKLGQIFSDLDAINLSLDLQDDSLSYENHVDPSIQDGLFDGAKR